MNGQMKIVGRYELLDPIGYGGMAVVYLARQLDLDRQVALKELRVFQAPDDPALAERFLREARMAGSMSHPNIVTVHEYFKHEDTPYIAMEYLQRGSLRPWVGRMTVAQIAGVLEGLLAALDHAERNRIVHRDLKPENLLVTDQGQVKVADFGIAKARTMNTSALLTAAGTTVGTPTYMAPEQAMAQELGPYTDLYSVGVMAYELFLGRPPFDNDTPMAVILRHVNEEIPPACSVDPSIDRALSDWIDRLLIKDPALRTQTAEAAWDELEEVVLALLGSRWRREARLLATDEQPAARPLTPAPFTSTDVGTPVPESPSDEFQSFAWGAPVGGAPETEAPLVSPPQPEPEPAPEPEPVPEPEPEPGPEPEPFVASAPAEPVVPPAQPLDTPVEDDADARTVMPDAIPDRMPPSAPPSPEILRRRRAALAGVGVVVVTATIGGFVLLGGGGSGEPPQAASARTASSLILDNDDLSLTLPSSWTKRTVFDDIPGLEPGNAVSAVNSVPANVLAAALVRGVADQSLLAPGLRSAVRGKRPRPVEVKLAGLEAYRYDGLRVSGTNERLRVFAVLTTDGVATIVCRAPASAAAATGCDEVARTLKLKSVRGLPPGPSEDFQSIIETTFATLNKRLKAIKTTSSTATGQAAEARQLGRAYRAAAAAIERAAERDEKARRADDTFVGLTPVDVGLGKRVELLFEKVAVVCQRLARAVRSGDEADVKSALRALAKARGTVKSTTSSLSDYGVTARLRSTPTPQVKQAPTTEDTQPTTTNPQPAPDNTQPPPDNTKPPPVPDDTPPPPSRRDDDE